MANGVETPRFEPKRGEKPLAMVEIFCISKCNEGLTAKSSRTNY
jgi:hypothetical protein